VDTGSIKPNAQSRLMMFGVIVAVRSASMLKPIPRPGHANTRLKVTDLHQYHPVTIQKELTRAEFSLQWRWVFI